MFDYDANIRLNINDTAALAALKKLEDRIAQLSDPRTAGALKNLTGSSKAKQEFSALKQERAEDLAYRKRKTRQIADELRLSNALELQEARRIKLQRAGALDVPSRKKAIAKLDKISAVNPKNAEIQERVATGLSRILTTQNEINRATNKNVGQKQRIADYNKQIDKLRELGATEGQLRKVQKRKYEFVDAAERRQTSLSDRRELQLKRELKLLGDTQKAARDAATAVTRPGRLDGGARLPVKGGKNIANSPAALQDAYDKALAEVARTEKAYRNQLSKNIQNNIDAEEKAKLASINRVAAAEKAQNKRINDKVKQSDRLQKAKEVGIAASAKAGGPSSPMRAQSVLGSDSSLRKKAEYYERVAKSVKATSSPMRAQSVLGSDSSLRKKAEYYERINKAIEGPSSSLKSGPAKSTLGSPKADKARFDFYEKNYKTALAKVFKTEQAYEKQLQANSLNNIKAEEAAELASIKRVAAAEKAQNKRTNDKVKQNDRLQKAKEVGKASKGKKGEGFLNFGKGQTNLAAGVGFPLLFGGGPGSVIGGGLGALAGGFGGSIIGGAIGTQLDKLGAAALSTADAFEKLGATASDLIPKLGRGAGEGFGGRAQFLIDEGSSSQVGEILRERFAEVYGDKALKEFEKLAEQNKKFKETWEEIGVELQRLMAGPLGALLKGLQGISNGLTGRGNEGVDERRDLNAKYTELQKQADAITKGGGQLSPAQQNTLENARLASAGASPDKQTSLNEDPDKKTAAEQKLIDLVNKKRKIEEAVNADKLAALEQALTARRDDLAILNTAAGITRATAELDNTRKELAAERNKILKDTLKITQLEKTEAEQVAEVERKRVAQANALRQAQLQIYKDVRNAIIETYKVDSDKYQIELKTLALSQTAYNQSQTRLKAVQEEANSQEQILRDKFALEKLEIKELEVIVEKAILLEAKVEKIKEELALKEKQIKQAEVLRQVGVEQYNQQQKLNTLLAEQNALRAIQANDPSRTLDFDAQGFGFFGDSFKLEADLFQKYNDDIDVFNRKIADAKANIAKLTEEDIRDGRADPFLKQLDTLRVLKGDYERLQPAINAAAIEQQRFNDAFAAVAPGVNALVGGLKDVVAGTKSAGEAFADFLNTIGEQLIQTAATMIAQYIAIGIARAFAMGSSPTFNPNAPSITGNSIGDFGGGSFGGFRANGGPVSANQPYIVGERGPELMIPRSSGTVLSNSDTRQQLSSQQNTATREQLNKMTTQSQPLNIRFESQVINGVEYVTAEQHRQGMTQAAERGRAMTLTTLQNSPRTRSKVGI